MLSKTEEAPGRGHALDAYRAFLGDEQRGLYQRMCHARRFARLYPDLDQWSAAPLQERIGSNAVHRGTGWARFKGRQYIYFLVSIGRIELDWAWILAVGCHFLKGILSTRAVALGKRLSDRLEELGFSSPGRSIPRPFRYFYLRYGEAFLTPNRQHFDEFAAASAELLSRPDLADFVDVEHLQRRYNVSTLIAI